MDSQSTLKLLVALGLYLLFLIPIMKVCMGLFPQMKWDANGIKYRIFPIFNGMIRWNEVDDIIDIKWLKNYKAVIISRKNFDFLFKGRWHNMIHGLIFGIGEPILLISNQMYEDTISFEMLADRVSPQNAPM